MMKPVSIIPLLGLLLLAPFTSADEIIHDAEYAIIEAQNGEAWAADDKALDKKLAEIRKKEKRRQATEHCLHPAG
jgi:arylsulfatase